MHVFILWGSGLEISYADKQVKGSSLILKDIIALGSVPNGLGKVGSVHFQFNGSHPTTYVLLFCVR